MVTSSGRSFGRHILSRPRARWKAFSAAAPAIARSPRGGAKRGESASDLHGSSDALVVRETQTEGEMIRRVLFVLAFGAAALVVGCGGGAQPGDESTRASPTATATSSPTATATPQGGIDTLSGASTRPVHVPATNRKTALLTDVRAARHEGFDRVVFQFRNALPGYDVRYVARPVRQDGSGKVVPLGGNYVVRVRMENALDADLTKPSAPMTYTGPQRFTPGTPEIAELARIGGFEGVLTWAAGLQDRVDFRVSTLTSPARLVVDFRNH
jgi:hypothetical protein